MYQTTEVYRYLVYIQQYLNGDLKLFERNCREAEKEEKLKLAAQKLQSSTTPVVQTTQYPYAFPFLFGEPLISRGTMPNTVMLFSTMDVLGYLITQGGDPNATKKNIEAFFKYGGINISPEELNVIVDVYRTGLAHTYFPKLNLSISCHSSNPPDKLFFKKGQEIVLNVNYLIDIVSQTITKLKDDSGQYPTMDKNYGLLVAGYENRHRAAIEALRAIIN